jgi:hexosaminidase
MNLNSLLLPKVKKYSESLESVSEVANHEVSYYHNASLPDQGYKINILKDTIRIEYKDDAAKFYADTTLKLIRLASNHIDIKVCEIEDWPDLKIRGVMLDVSRDRIPTMEYLFALIDRLSMFKCNHLELYFEHSFSYKNHEIVWQNKDPFSPSQIKLLKDYCKERYIDLVANQNTFGHMERWLIHQKYRHLALKPSGFRDNLGLLKPPTTLNPDSNEAIALVEDLIGQLYECFDSQYFHIGMDEPWELKDPIGWVNWLKRLSNNYVLKDKNVLIWADVLAAHPKLIGEVPENFTVCEWGYEANHPFDQRLKNLITRNTWTCSGTSSWISLIGRFNVMMENTRLAALKAKEYALDSTLITDWGDLGHLQPPLIAEPGFYTGLSFAWNTEPIVIDHLYRGLDLFGFDSIGLSEFLNKLSDIQLELPLQFPNLASIAINLYFPQLPTGAAITSGATKNTFAKCKEHLANLKLKAPELIVNRSDSETIFSELNWLMSMMDLLIDDHLARLEGDGNLQSIDDKKRKSFRDQLSELEKQYANLWVKRSRPGGLDDSRRWLRHLSKCYETGTVNQDWSGPMAEDFFKENPLPID